MLRRDYFADRMYRDQLDGIDRQPPLLNSQIPDVSLDKVIPPNLPPPKIPLYPPLITTTIGGGFKKVIPKTTVGDIGGVDLEAKGKKFSIFIIGAVIVVGIIATRR